MRARARACAREPHVPQFSVGVRRTARWMAINNIDSGEGSKGQPSYVERTPRACLSCGPGVLLKLVHQPWPFDSFSLTESVWLANLLSLSLPLRTVRMRESCGPGVLLKPAHQPWPFDSFSLTKSVWRLMYANGALRQALWAKLLGSQRLPSGHTMVTQWSPNGHPMVTTMVTTFFQGILGFSTKLR